MKILVRVRVLSVLATVALGVGLSLSGVGPASAFTDVMTYGSPQEVVGAPQNPHDGVIFGDGLYFVAKDPVGDERLYKFDGTAFTVIDDDRTDPRNLLVANGALYYSALASDGLWKMLAYDGTSPSEMESLESSFAPLEAAAIPGTEKLAVALPLTDSLTNLISWSPTSMAMLDTFAYITDLTTFDNFVYFTGTPRSESYHQMFRTDGTTVELARPGAGEDMTVWNGLMYMGFESQNYAFYVMQPDLSLDPAQYPNIEYARLFTDGGDALYFEAAADVGDVVYSFDGTTAAPIPGSPFRASNFTMFDGNLVVMGDMNGSLQVCSLDVSVQCAESGSIYMYDGSGWTWLADTDGRPQSIMVYNGVLYYDEGNRWMLIDTAQTLPNTGLELAPMVWAALLALVSGGALMVIRRRNGRTTTD